MTKQSSNETAERHKDKYRQSDHRRDRSRGRKGLCHTRVRGKCYFGLEILAARPGEANRVIVQRASAAFACTSWESFKINSKSICFDTNQPVSNKCHSEIYSNLQKSWTCPQSSPAHLFLLSTALPPYSCYTYAHQHQSDVLVPVQ